MKKKLEKKDRNTNPTPVKEADAFLGSQGIYPGKHQYIRKRFISIHALTIEVISAAKITTNKCKIANVVVGKDMKKTRNISFLSKAIGIARKQL